MRGGSGACTSAILVWALMALVVVVVGVGTWGGKPLLEDATAESSFQEEMYLTSIAAGGAAFGRTFDMDGDGRPEIVIYSNNMATCETIIPQLSVFSTTNTSSGKYEQLNRNEGGFLNHPDVRARSLSPLRSVENSLVDILMCLIDGPLALYKNHGGLNFTDQSSVYLPTGQLCGGSLLLTFDSRNVGYDDSVLMQPNSPSSYFLTRHSNGSMVPAEYRLPGLTLLNLASGAFGDLNGDGFVDVVVKGLDSSTSIAFTMLYRNVGGNFTALNAAFVGSWGGSVVIAEFTGDGVLDVVLTGRMPGLSYVVQLYRNNGSFVFQLMNSTGLMNVSIEWFAAAAPLRKQSNAFDLILSSFVGTRVYLNNGSGTFDDRTPPSLPSAFQSKAVFQGPSLGANEYPTLIAATSLIPATDAIYAVYYDGGAVLDARPSLFLQNISLLYSVYSGAAATMDVNYDGCADIYFTGLTVLNVMFSSVMVGDCSGKFTNSPIASTFPALVDSAAFWVDFDLDGRLEVFLTGNRIGFVEQAIYYRIERDGGLTDLGLDKFIGFAPMTFANGAVGHLDGDNYPDMMLSGEAGGLGRLHLYINLRNGSFGDRIHLVSGAVTDQLYEVAIVGDATSTWSDVVAVASNSISSFQYYRNNRNGTFVESSNSVALFPSGPPISVYDSSIQAADITGDGQFDFFYNGYHGSFARFLYIRSSNGSYEDRSMNVPNSSAVSRGVLAFFDVDLDGDMDLLVSGRVSYSSTASRTHMYLNEGNGTFVDRTVDVLGASPPSCYDGALVVGQFTNDSMPDVFVTGYTAGGCGPKFLLQRFPPPNSSTSTIDGGSSSNDNAALIGALVGSLGGAALLLLLLCCCCCLLCCCIAFVVLVVVIVVAALLVVLFVVGLGGFAIVDGTVVFLLMKKKNDGVDGDEEMDELDVSSLIAAAERVNDYPIIKWADIHPVRKLGEGAFGEVLLCEWNGVEVAVKIFKNATKETASECKHEALMMAKVSHHPHVVRFLGASFHDQSIAMVMTLCAGGSLLTALEKKRLSADDKQRILIEVASALSFLHSLGIVHRDLAARNVLLDGHGGAKLADLGLSRLLEDHQSEQTTASTIGPVRWMAPEAMRSRKYSAASDCYSFAMLMYEVWTDGQLPFSHIRGLTDVAMAVLQQDERPTIPESMPLAHERLMRQQWQREPSARPSMSDALSTLQSSSSNNGESASTADHSGDAQYGSNYAPIIDE